MATTGCTIDENGIRAPSYAEILASLQDSARTIFGADLYLEPDSQDGQLLGIFAQAIKDSNDATIATYYSYSPTYAQGAALAANIKINGLTVRAATKSTVVVLIEGRVGAEIRNGVVQDTLGNLWNLPPRIAIGASGSISVTATAQQAGAITAGPGTVIGIYTPTFGWQSVTNVNPAVPGAPAPTDAQIRRAQRAAVALPSQSIDAGILAAVRNVAGVSEATLYENDTNTTDGNGLPGHSIAVVAAGGNVEDIVSAIGSRKTPGTSTVGTISGVYTDPVVGLSSVINYYPLTPAAIRLDLQISIRQGFTYATNSLITNALVSYVNSLGVGVDVYLSKLYGPANLYGDAATSTSGLPQAVLNDISDTYTITGLMIGPQGGGSSMADYPIGFTSAASLAAVDVTITVV